MSHLLGIHGLSGSGKDTLALRLRTAHGWRRMAFADPLREAAAAAFGIDMEWLNDPNLKATEHPFWGMTPRHILQHMGTEAMRRTFGEDIWIKRWRKEWDPSIPTVITDVRENAEAKAIVEAGGRIIKLVRGESGLSGVAGQHSSEAGIDRAYVWRTIENNGTVKELWGQVDLMVHRGLRHG